MHQRFCIAAVLALAVTGPGWVRPQLPSKLKTAEQFGAKLDYLMVNVNGQAHMVPEGSELAVVRGDQVEVQRVALHDPKMMPKIVHVVGITGGGPHGDDRGVAFSTERLRPQFSEGKQGHLYAVMALSKGVLHGAIYLKIIEPELKYAEVTVNGKALMLRDHETLSVKRTDQFKVERVVTNLESTGDVLFQVDPGTGPGEYAIHFTRGGAPFAEIPLRVSE